MSKIVQTTIQEVIHLYQSEIHKKNPSISMKQLQEIWKQIDQQKEFKKDSKKKKTAYQNFFTIARVDVTNENPKLKFGEISKIISSRWNTMSADEKKKYESQEEDIMSNFIQKEPSDENYIHLFENHIEEDDLNCNRIDYEEDDEDIEIEDEEEDDINFDDIE